MRNAKNDMPRPWTSRGLSLVTILALGTVLGGCQTGGPPSPAYLPAVPSLGGIDDLDVGPPPRMLDEVTVPRMKEFKAGEMTAVRQDGLQEAALAYGSQLGYARRAWEIGRALERRSRELAEAYDFARVSVPAPRNVGFLVPPVVVRAFTPYTVKGDSQSASASDEYLEIVTPARLSPKVPTWHDYLLIDPGAPEEPDNSLRPKDKEEEGLYRKWLAEGWKAGVDLANEAFEEKLNRLQRDYEGMLQYRRLVALNMVDEMVVADADFGTVVEDDGAVMRIGERSVNIVSAARLSGNTKSWRPVLVNARWQEIVNDGAIDPNAAHSPIRPVAPSDLTSSVSTGAERKSDVKTAAAMPEKPSAGPGNSNTGLDAAGKAR